MTTQQKKIHIVLVVDDEALLRMRAVDFLNDAGYSTIEAQDGEDALKALDANPGIGCVFTDINMPGTIDGLELVAHVSQRRPDVRLIVASGMVTPGQGTLPPGGCFVAKPYTAKSITDLVAKPRLA